jgi:DNA-binding transcriptional LysR family regulator
MCELPHTHDSSFGPYPTYIEAMDLRRLRTFISVAELGTLEAALRLGITQPAHSRQISDLQQEPGLRVLTGLRGLVLIAEIEQFLGDCSGVLGHIDSARGCPNHLAVPR